MKRVVLDLEASGLLPQVDRLYVVCVLDCKLGTIQSYLEHERDRFVEESKEWDEIIFHNGLGYDLWVLWKLWDISFEVGPDTWNGRAVKWVDTLVWSKYLHPDRPGGQKPHSLKEWGERLGFPKGEHNDWSQYSEAMHSYCIQDTKVCYEVFKVLQKEIA